METRATEAGEADVILDLDEGHFLDLKSRDVAPAKLQRHFVAFANTDGGELYIGVEDRKYAGDRLRGFGAAEDANEHVQVLLAQTSPAVEDVVVEFIDFAERGLVLHLSVPKSPKVHYTASGDCYIRRNASSRKIVGGQVTALAYSKGALHYERQVAEDVELDDLLGGEALSDYMIRIGTQMDPPLFLRKQRCAQDMEGTLRPNVCGVLLFDDEPQAALRTKCAIKISRLRTTSAEYQREQLGGHPETIVGAVETQARKALDRIAEILDGEVYVARDGMQQLKYPPEALKEVLVNAVIHRDYSIADDIHVRIYDNRVEVQSPGRLPGYITVENIYDERLARNPNLVRLLNRLPDPLNHDIGEGLDTARNELRRVGLVAPTIDETETAVTVTLRHQRLASVEKVILQYLDANPDATITNGAVRKLSGEDDRQKVKKTLQRLRAAGAIQVVDLSATVFKMSYCRGPSFAAELAKVNA